MATSYRKRYEGEDEEIKEHVREFGLLPAQDIHKARSLDAWERHVASLMGSEKYEFITKAVSQISGDFAKEFVAQFLMQYAEMRDNYALMKEQYEALKKETEIRKVQDKITFVRLQKVLI